MIELSVLAHVTDDPVTVFPRLSVRVAVSCCELPATTLADGGSTVTAATVPAETERLAVPEAPPAAAVMFALPAPFAVTSPLDDTVMIELFDDDQATS